MNRKIILLAAVTLTLVTLACSFTINLPDIQPKTGSTETENINIPFLADKQAIADVTLKFGAGNLYLQPGAANELINGTATYNVADFKPVITIDSNNINIEQGNMKLTGIPNLSTKVINDWNLSFGNSPISLVINAGAYKGNFELGGLSIHRLEIIDGAATVHASFSKPNQIEMSSFLYTTGASDVTLEGLANTNSTDMRFRSGAGSYTLDFSGELAKDMSVNVESGVSSVKIIIPAGKNAEVVTDNALISVSTSGNWQQLGNTYTLSGSGNTITIQVKMGAGSLRLETSR